MPRTAAPTRTTHGLYPSTWNRPLSTSHATTKYRMLAMTSTPIAIAIK